MASSDDNPAAGAPERRMQLLEMLVFLFLIVPPMLLATVALRQQTATFSLVAWASILRDLALISLIAYFILRNREPRESIGWNFRMLRREMALGAMLFVPLFFLAFLVEGVFHAMGFSVPSGSSFAFLTPHGAAQMVLACLLVVVVAFCEETIFRGYLILRLRAVSGSTAVALILSTLIFAAGHGYEGSAGVATVFVMGLVFGLVYLWRRSLVASMTMHFLQDFTVIVLLPLFHLMK